MPDPGYDIIKSPEEQQLDTELAALNVPLVQREIGVASPDAFPVPVLYKRNVGTDIESFKSVDAETLSIDEIVWKRTTLNTTFESLDGFGLHGVGYGSVINESPGVHIETGSSSGDISALYLNPVTFGQPISTYYSPVIQVRAVVVESTGCEAFIGLTESTNSWVPSNPTGLDYAGFLVSSNTIYAGLRIAPGGTQSKTVIGVNPSDGYHDYRVEVEAASSSTFVKSFSFYVDGVLVNKISNVNVMIEEMDIYMGIKNTVGSATRFPLRVAQLYFSQDFI